MRGSIFIFNFARASALLLTGLCLAPPLALAEAGSGAASGAPSKEDRTQQPEDEDFSNTPFTEYGEFNEEAEETATTRFYQQGRLFGLGIGVGLDGATGNRGKLWQGGFPQVNLQADYWFDFNLALIIGVSTVQHTFDTVKSGTKTASTNVNLTRLGLDLKYYFDTKNLSAAISFSNPHIFVGYSNYTKSETLNLVSAAGDPPVKKLSQWGPEFGVGLEFPIRPRKTYIGIEGSIAYVPFDDQSDASYRQTDIGIPDLKGLFYTVTFNVLFTW